MVPTEKLSVLIFILACSKCYTNSTQQPDIKRDKHLTLPFRAELNPDYDENDYKDIGVVGNLRNQTLNQTNSIRNEDDEDTTNGDYLDELGSTTDDIFQLINPDPYLGVHFLTNKTTPLPTTTTILQEAEDTQMDFEVTDPMITFLNTVPNYSNDTLPKCPYGFETFQNEEGTTTCFLENEPSVFPPICPYVDYLESHAIPHQITVNKTIWTKATTKMFDNFGSSFVTDTWSYKAGNTECATFHRPNIITTPCNDSHSSICAFSYEDNKHSFDDYCRKKFNESCVAADLGSGSKCYCVVRSQISGQIRSNFCNKLAEPLEPYQNILLLKLLSNDDVCWIGFYQDTDTYKWSSTNSSTNYTYWSFTTDFTKTYGAIGQEAWSLENDGDLSCSVCEVDVTHHSNVRLRIKHNKITNKIRLTIDNAFEIYGGVYCYSYGNEYYIDLSAYQDNHLEIDVYEVNDIPRYYWCKAFEIPHLKAIYSNRILARAVTANSGREYAIILSKGEIPSSPYYMTQLVFNERDHALYHIHTVPSNYTIQEEIDFLTKYISADIRSSEVCLPSSTSSNNITLTWHQTVIGSTILPDVHCYQDNGYPVTRKCSGSFLYGASWSSVSGTCTKIGEMNTTLLRTNWNSSVITIEEKHSLVEIHSIINILRRTTNFTEFIYAVDNLMNYPTKKLKETQRLLNSTDSLLDTLKIHLIEEMDRDTLTSINLVNLAIGVTNLSDSSAIGFNLSTNETFITTGLATNFDVIVKIPEELHKEAANCSTAPPKVVVTLFKNDAFFGDSQHSHLVQGNVIMVDISRNCNFSAYNEEFITLIAKTNEEKQLKCASWNYGNSELMENIKGSWFIDSPALEQTGPYKMCNFKYGSYSALLEEAVPFISDNNRTLLIVLGTIVGVFVVSSLVTVLITIVVFKVYSYSHTAIINLSVSAAAQLIATFAVMIFKIEDIGCVTIAAAIHYTTLAQFLWMLIVVWLQHNFYITNQQPKMAANMYFVAWGIPLAAVVLLVSVSRFNYGIISNYEVCYAMGNNFTYSVLMAVSILLIVILAMFGKITGSIKFSKKIKTYHLIQETSFSQLKLAAMLYLVLGITWGLGIIAVAVERSAIPYLYALTACMQETVIFLFFIVLDERTRTLWVGVKNACFLGKSKGYQLTPKRKGRRPKYSTSRF